MPAAGPPSRSGDEALTERVMVRLLFFQNLDSFQGTHGGVGYPSRVSFLHID